MKVSSERGVSTTAVAIGLNILLLAMIVFGYTQSEDLRWAWILVGIPIVIVTATYVRHWFQLQSHHGSGDSVSRDTADDRR